MEAGRRNDTVTVLFLWSREIIGELMFASTDRRFLEGLNWDVLGIKIAYAKPHYTLVDLEAFIGTAKLMAIQYHKDIQSAACRLCSEG